MQELKKELKEKINENQNLGNKKTQPLVVVQNLSIHTNQYHYTTIIVGFPLAN